MHPPLPHDSISLWEKLTLSKPEGIYNFSAGPSVLPEPVFDHISKDLYNWQGSNVSVLEMSHRGDEFGQILQETTRSLTQLLNIPEGYKVLFLQGGARLQFSMIPMSFLKGSCQYMITGIWSEIAAREADVFGQVKRQNLIEKSSNISLLKPATWQFDSKSSYCHLTSNETINGIEYFDLPKWETPFISDVSSTILSRPFDLKSYDLIYACAQKNMGISGVTIVIMKEELLKRAAENLPSMMDYRNHISAGSLYNTSPTFGIYVSGLLFQWLLDEGGVDEMARRSLRKSQKLYDYIDESDFYSNNIDKSCRSQTNVVFALKKKEKEADFIAYTKKAGILNIKGHRLVGGMRASLYNAMPEAGVDRLLEVMSSFANKNK